MEPKAKIFLRFGDTLLFSIKRSPFCPQKDQKLELVGGGIEMGETPMEGLIRELAEEESSGILAKKATLEVPQSRKVFVADEPHFIYDMAITQTDIDQLRMNDTESYGFQLLHKSELADDPVRFTPKTLGIFRALGLIPPSSSGNPGGI